MLPLIRLPEARLVVQFDQVEGTFHCFTYENGRLTAAEPIDAHAACHLLNSGRATPDIEPEQTTLPQYRAVHNDNELLTLGLVAGGLTLLAVFLILAY